MAVNPPWKTAAVLTAIGAAAPRECITEAQLVELTGHSAGSIEESCRKLRKHGLLVKTARGCHKLTDAGRAALAEGKKLHSGPNGPDLGRRQRKGTLRERAWRAMRLRRKFTIADLVMLCAEGAERDIESNLGKYLRALARAGYVRQLPVREAPTSASGNGYVRYLLLRDHGAQAPVWRLQYGEIWDPNVERTYPIGEAMEFASRRRVGPGEAACG